MSDPVVALSMLAIFLFIILLGFPVAFTLMAMGIGFGYYAYFDADRMWRAYNKAVEAAGHTMTVENAPAVTAALRARGGVRSVRARSS